MMRQAPKGWRDLWTAAVRYRRTLHAPVDTVGCEGLSAAVADPKSRRFVTLLSLMLSAQTKDAVTAAAVGKIVDYFPTPVVPSSICTISVAQLDSLISSVGFHNRKAQFIKQTAELLVEKHDGDVPSDLDELLKLPGVGPKMAHLYLLCALNRCEGIGVDTHVHRIARRFRWTTDKATTPEKTREQLESWLPKQCWRTINLLLVGLGQTVCRPVNPLCGECALRKMCPSSSCRDALTTSEVALLRPPTCSSVSHSLEGDGAIELCGAHSPTWGELQPESEAPEESAVPCSESAAKTARSKPRNAGKSQAGSMESKGDESASPTHKRSNSGSGRSQKSKVKKEE